MMCHPTQDDDAAAGVQRQGDNGGKTANKNLVMAALSRCLGQQKNQKEMTPYLPKIRTLTKFLGKIAKMLLDEANDFSCATTDVLAFKMLYLTSFF